MKLSRQAQAVFDEYKARSQRELELQRSMTSASEGISRDDLLLPIGEEVATLLHTLIVAKGARNVLELGTSYGYSTLVLADAVRLTGGRLTTLDLVDYKQQHAREALTRAGLEQYVQWQLGDALDILQRLDGPFDVVLLDIWKELYIPCLELFYPKLAQGAVIVADNMVIPERHQANAKAYQDRVRAMPDILDSQLHRIGTGIEVSCFWRQ